MELAYFVLFVSVLIFVHEAGHFAFAKIFGVKVLTFSIGFGPRILRIRGRETEYCIALLPFGGFVKLLEESRRGEVVLPEERGRTFEAQAAWKRVLIVLAGPAMNLVFPIVLYASVYFDDKELLAPTVGIVLPGRAADGVLKAGDRIASLDGKPMDTFLDVQAHIAKRGGRPVRATVARDGKFLDLTLTPDVVTLRNELDMVTELGRLGIQPTPPAAVIGLPKRSSPAFRAGLRTFDRIVAVDGKRIDTYFELTLALSQNRGKNTVITYLRPKTVPDAIPGLCELAVLEPGVATVAPLPKQEGQGVAIESSDVREEDVLQRYGIESSEMYVAYVAEGSSEWQAGIRPLDRITHLNGVPQRLWGTRSLEGQARLSGTGLEDEILRRPQDVHELRWLRAGEPMAGRFQVRREKWQDELGQPFERFVFRTSNWAPLAKQEKVPNPSRVMYALTRGVEETYQVLTFIIVGFVRMAEGKIQLSTVSGPITIYDIAGKAGALGPNHFVWAMALVSLNLGLLNLLPIPVLDGGQLLFILIEAVRRKPLPVRVREIASLVGLLLLLVVMAFAFKNDLERRVRSTETRVSEANP